MGSGISIEAEKQTLPPFDIADVEAAKNAKLQIYGMDVNYAAANSWYAFFPIEDILGRKYRNLNLHITRFSLPQMEVGTTSVPYKGYEKEMSTKMLNPGSKQLTIDYIIDEKWHNYRCLFAWLSSQLGNLNKVTTDEKDGISASDYLTLRIYLLDNFKQKIIEFVFENCWIKQFGDVALEQDNSHEIAHSFTLCYDRYYIADL